MKNRCHQLTRISIVLITLAITCNSASAVNMRSWRNLFRKSNKAHTYAIKAYDYTIAGDYDLAIEYCTRSIDQDPNYSYAYGLRASCYCRLEKTKLGFLDCNRTISLDPHNANAYTLRASIFLRRGHYNNAIEDCNRAIDIDPRNSYAFGLRGWIYGEQGKNNMAYKDLDMAIEIEPDRADYYLWRADIFLDENKLEESLSDFEKANTLDPNSSYSSFFMAQMAERKGETTKALEILDQMLKEKPEFQEALNAKAYILCTTQDDALRNGEEAIKLAKKALALSDNHSPHINNTIACAYAEVGQFEKAIEIQKDVVKTLQDVQDMKDHLKAFEEGKPWRESIVDTKQ